MMHVKKKKADRRKTKKEDTELKEDDIKKNGFIDPFSRFKMI